MRQWVFCQAAPAFHHPLPLFSPSPCLFPPADGVAVYILAIAFQIIWLIIGHTWLNRSMVGCPKDVLDMSYSAAIILWVFFGVGLVMFCLGICSEYCSTRMGAACCYTGMLGCLFRTLCPDCIPSEEQVARTVAKEEEKRLQREAASRNAAARAQAKAQQSAVQNYSMEMRNGGAAGAGAAGMPGVLPGSVLHSHGAAGLAAGVVSAGGIALQGMGASAPTAPPAAGGAGMGKESDYEAQYQAYLQAVNMGQQQQQRQAQLQLHAQHQRAEAMQVPVAIPVAAVAQPQPVIAAAGPPAHMQQQYAGQQQQGYAAYQQAPAVAYTAAAAPPVPAMAVAAAHASFLPATAAVPAVVAEQQHQKEEQAAAARKAGQSFGAAVGRFFTKK